jgi:serine/threonine-protein kinase
MQYVILDHLGSGGMGDIYRAKDSRLNRIVAIKVLPRADADESRRQRFLQEAQAASALNHPNIITIHDIIADDQSDLMVMELVSGKTLSDITPPTGLAVYTVLRYAVQITSALAAAHAAGIVHRDIKPHNIMVTDSGLIKLLDFGLAKPTFSGGPTDSGMTRTSASPLTIQGTLLGTPNYMSPEQAEAKTVDARSDIFSLGIVLYEMVTGRNSFVRDSMIATMSAIMRDEPHPIIELAPNTPQPLIDLIEKCLRKNAADRWQSMEELRAAIEKVKQSYDSRASAPTMMQAPATRLQVAPAAVVKKSSKLPLAIGGAVAVLAVGGWFATRPKVPVSISVQVPGGPNISVPGVSISGGPPAPVPPSAPAAGTGLTNDSIVQMSEGKVPSAIILDSIRAASKTQFDLSPGELVRLTKAGVPGDVIQAMRDPSKLAAAKGRTNSSASQPDSPAAPVNSSAVPAGTASSAPHPVADGWPIPIELAADIPNDAPVGAPLNFKVTKDMMSGGVVVIPKGAAVTGEVVEASRKKALVMSVKMTFQLTRLEAVNGQKLNLRATPTRGTGPKALAVDSGSNKKKSKDVAATAGTEYLAYIDGDQIVTLRK